MPENGKYLLTFSFDGEFYAELLTMAEIAEYVGFADCTDYTDFRVYNIVRGVPEQLGLMQEHNCTIALYDGGILIDFAEYPEH